MNLSEVREKYPTYKDMSDEELATGLHQKFYSDMDFQEFSNQIGYKPNNVTTPTPAPTLTPTPKAPEYDMMGVGNMLPEPTIGKEDYKKFGAEAARSANEMLDTIRESGYNLPVGVMEGLMTFTSSLPAFTAGMAGSVVEATKEIAKLDDPFATSNWEPIADIYEGMKRGFSKYHDAVKKYLPAYEPKLEPKMAELTNKIAFAPFEGALAASKDIANIEGMEEFPNLQAGTEIVGLMMGAAAQGVPGKQIHALLKDRKIDLPAEPEVLDSAYAKAQAWDMIQKEVPRAVKQTREWRRQQAIERNLPKLQNEMQDNLALHTKDTLPNVVDIPHSKHYREVRDNIGIGVEGAEGIPGRTRFEVSNPDPAFTPAELDGWLTAIEKVRPKVTDKRVQITDPAPTPKPEPVREYGTKYESERPHVSKEIKQQERRVLSDPRTPVEESASVFLRELESRKSPQARENLLNEARASQAAGGEPFPISDWQANLFRQQEIVRSQLSQSDMVGEIIGPRTLTKDLPFDPHNTRTTYWVNRGGTRGFLTDLNTAFGSKGQAAIRGGWDLTREQKKSRQRINQDLQMFKSYAERAGKSLEQTLIDMGTDPIVARTFAANAPRIEAGQSIVPNLAQPEPVRKKVTADGKTKPSNVTTPKEPVPPKGESMNPIDYIANMEAESVGDIVGLEGYQRAKFGAVKLIDSPQVVYESYGGAIGKRVFDEYALQDQRGAAFYVKEGGILDKATAWFKEGDAIDTRIAKALDGKLDPAELSKKERKTYTVIKDWFRDLLYDYAKDRVSSPQVYERMLLETKDRNPNAEWLKSLSKSDRAIADLLSRRIDNYLPHMFDRKHLVRDIKTEIRQIQADPKNFVVGAVKYSEKAALKHLENLQNSLQKLAGGDMILYDDIPKNIQMRYFNQRKGKQGKYALSVKKTGRSYLGAMRRKRFDELALKYASENNRYLSPELRKYNTWFAKRYMGMSGNELSGMANAITTFEYARTIGLNPRSALQNYTQRLNTYILEPKYAPKAQTALYQNSKWMNKVYDDSGLKAQVPEVLNERTGKLSERTETVVNAMTTAFRYVEGGNRKHAWLTGYLKAGGKLKTPYELMDPAHVKAGFDMVSRTQFDYGRLGKPMFLDHPVTQVGFQFSSFSIKQLEYARHLWKTDKRKFAAYAALGLGAPPLVSQFLDTNISNALGFGVDADFGTLSRVIDNIEDDQWRKAVVELRTAFSTGSGILPNGFGPGAMAIYNIATGTFSGDLRSVLKEEVTPVALGRILQFKRALDEGGYGSYPIYNKQGHKLYELDERQLLQRTFAFGTGTEAASYRQYKRDQLFDESRMSITREITRNVLDGNIDKAVDLVQTYQLKPTREQLREEKKKRLLDAATRRRLNRTKNQRLYDRQGEDQ